MARFFQRDERVLVESLADAMLPGERSVGAVSAGAVEYIDRFLAAFDAPVPEIFRGGPFSGRQPYPDRRTGRPTDRYPDDDFAEILPPTRLQELAFRILLYGSDSVENGDINDPILGPRPGLRKLYRAAIQQLRVGAVDRGAESFAELGPGVRLDLFGEAPTEFQEAFLTHLAEGLFCPPEYGGNRDGIVWRDYHYDGDSQPLGYTLFDRDAQTLFDRPDRPNQTLDPRRSNDGLEPGVVEVVAAAVAAVGGRRFF